MIMHKRLVCSAMAAFMAAAPLPGFAACTMRSGATTAALVELYTSEGCSSCPPADEQLRRLREAVDPNASVFPLALHVDYWDSIGWKDPYAKPAFSERQRWLVQSHGNTTVYTPHFFVNGSELDGWRGRLRSKIRETNALPAVAAIELHAGLSSTGDRLDILADASTRSASARAALYLAVAESGLVSKVTRGENSGSTLAHDHVVREWIGPIALRDGKAHLQQALSLPATWNRAQLEIVAFVEDEGTGRVLQAAGAQQCAQPQPGAPS
jgi:hypothetical protein